MTGDSIAGGRSTWLGRNRIRKLLAKSPSTVYELAASEGIDGRFISIALAQMIKSGQVRTVKRIRQKQEVVQLRWCNLYELTAIGKQIDK